MLCSALRATSSVSARFPSQKAVRINDIPSLYGAVDFRQALAEFILKTSNPNLTVHQIRALAPRYSIPFQTVPVFYKIKFWNEDAQGREEAAETLDCVHVRPAHKDSSNRKVPSRFDTVLINEKDGKDSGVAGAETTLPILGRQLIPRLQVIALGKFESSSA